MVEASLVPQIFSNISQVVATILSFYLAVFIFFWSYMSKNNFKKRLNKKDIKLTTIFTILFSLGLLYLNKIFVYPSIELGALSYAPLVFILIYMTILISLFIDKKKIIVLEKGLLTFSVIFTFFAVILGFYVIFSSISSLPFSHIVSQDYVYNLIKFSRLFFLTILNSIISIVFFVFIHKFLSFSKK